MKTTPLRPAGNHERSCIVRHDLGLYGNLIVAGLYQLDLEAAQDNRPLFISALEQCITTHPLLSASITEPEEKPFYVRPDFLDLNNHITFMPPLTQDVDEKRLTKDYLTSFIDVSPPYREGIPAWRLIIQPLSNSSFWVGLSYCHSVGDGRSGLAFHRTLLQALQEVEASTIDGAMTVSTAGIEALPPTMEKAVVLPISWGFLLGPLLSVYMPKSISSFLGITSATEDKWIAAPYTDNGGKDRITGIQLVTLDAETTLQLLKACKAHDTKLTGLLHQAIAHSLADALVKSGFKVSSSRPTVTLSASTPLDLRKLVPAYTPDTVINCASQATETWTITPLSSLDPALPAHIWTAAARTSAQLAASTSTLHNQVTGLLHYLRNYRPWLSDKLGKARDESFEVSNLGVFAPSAQTGADVRRRKARVTQMAFAQPANAVGAAVDCGVVSTAEGGLCMAFTWQRGVLGFGDEDGFVGDVVEGVEGFLGKACRG